MYVYLQYHFFIEVTKMKKQFGTNEGYIVYCDDDLLRITMPKNLFGFGGDINEIPTSEIKFCAIDDLITGDYLLTFVDKHDRVWQQLKIDERNSTLAEKIKDFFNKDISPQDLQRTFYREFERNMPMKKSKLSLVALILGMIASVILVSAWLAPVKGDEFAQLGANIGRAIVMPSAICTLIAVILNAIGYFLTNRALTLTSAIFYVLGLVLMPFWGFVGIPSMILQFIAFAKMKKPTAY